MNLRDLGSLAASSFANDNGGGVCLNQVQNGRPVLEHRESLPLFLYANIPISIIIIVHPIIIQTEYTFSQTPTYIYLSINLRIKKRSTEYDQKGIKKSTQMRRKTQNREECLLRRRRGEVASQYLVSRTEPCVSICVCT